MGLLNRNARRRVLQQTRGASSTEADHRPAEALHPAPRRPKLRSPGFPSRRRGHLAPTPHHHPGSQPEQTLLSHNARPHNRHRLLGAFFILFRRTTIRRPVKSLWLTWLPD